MSCTVYTAALPADFVWILLSACVDRTKKAFISRAHGLTNDLELLLTTVWIQSTQSKELSNKSWTIYTSGGNFGVNLAFNSHVH